MIYAAILLSVSIACLFLYFSRKLDDQWQVKNQVKERIGSGEALAAAPAIRKTQNLSAIASISKLLDGRETSSELSMLLRTAKWTVSVSIFVLASAVTSIAAFILSVNFLPPYAAAAFAATAGMGPYVVLKAIRRRYTEKFGQYLPDTLGIISNAIKVGHGLETAMEVVAQSAPYPVCDEFKTVRAELKLGVSLQQALDNLYKRIKSPELKILITGIAVHQELGGNLSEILDNLQKTIRERFSLMREIKTLSAQGVMSAWVLFAIPFFFVGLWMSSDPKTFMGFVQSPAGRMGLTVCVVFQAISFVWIRRIIDLRN